jgi:hypothetical protein
MPTKRMNREEFFAKLSPLDEDGLRKVLWSLYWRGPAALRERIEAELDPAEQDRRRREAAAPPAADLVLGEVTAFAGLARAGAYIAGDRRVSPKERTQWRATFRRLAASAESALRAEDPAPAEEALVLLIDLACETRRLDYFRSEDPMAAAQFVVSETVALLWETMRDRHGFAAFAERAAPQLARWESRWGWTRRGEGKVSEKETSLASVLARMLHAPEAWTVIADQYLDALDRIAGTEAARSSSRRSWDYHDPEWARRERAEDLAEWHDLLVDRLDGSEAEDRLDRLVIHPALGGPELAFVQARLAHRRGDTDAARKLIHACLEDLPGNEEFAGFAAEIGAELPRHAQQVADDRALWLAAISAEPDPQ